MKIQPMPPLNALIVFESSARLLSFTNAAAELCVTQGAISRQIKILEEYLGKELFFRDKRTIKLTPSGKQYYESVCKNLLSIAKTTSEIKKWQGENQVTIAISHAMASLWLLPLLYKNNLCDNIDLRIQIVENIDDLIKIDYDFAIIYSRTQPHNFRSIKLFEENIFPVCSPNFIGKENISLNDLFEKTVLYMDDLQPGWISWSHWFEMLNIDEITPKNKININNYPLIIQSAVNNQGVALGWDIFLDDYLNSNLLIKPIDISLSTGHAFWLIESLEKNRENKAVKKIKNWIVSKYCN